MVDAAYWKGLAAGLLACGVLGAGVHAWLSGGTAVPATEALVFDPPLLSALDRWMLPGQSRSFTVQLHNRGREPAGDEAGRHWRLTLSTVPPLPPGRRDLDVYASRTDTSSLIGPIRVTLIVDE